MSSICELNYFQKTVNLKLSRKKMWRNQSYSTSRDSMLDLGKEATTAGGSNIYSTFSNDNSIADKIRGKSACRNGESWKPPYVGRCLGECDVTYSHKFASTHTLTIIKNQFIIADFSEQVQLSFNRRSTWLCDNELCYAKLHASLGSRLTLL